MGAPKSNTITRASLDLPACVVSTKAELANAWASALGDAVGEWFDWKVSSRLNAAAEVLFVDAALPDLVAYLERVDRRGKAIFLIVQEDGGMPPEVIEDQADGVIVYPFRALEVLDKLRQHQRILSFQEAMALNVSYSQVVEKLQGSLLLAERMQKSKLPIRFPDVRGFKIMSRYLAGERAGGDYADLAESRDGQQVVLVMTDSSSYHLSSAVMETLPRAMSGLTIEETRSCVSAARRIRDGVLAALNDQDRLSLFYGVMSRKDYRLKFVNLGGLRVFYAKPKQAFEELVAQGDALVRAQGVRADQEGEVVLEPEGRLVLVSQGFVDAAGGGDALRGLLDRFRGQESKDTLNELVFRVKAPLTGDDALPARDCTAVVFDVDSRVMRLA